MAECNDRQLILLLQNNPSQGLAEAMAQYGAPVKRICAAILGAENRQEVEEAISDSFVALWKGLDRYDPERPLSAWLYGIARRTALERRRKLGRALPFQERDEQLPGDDTDPADQAAERVREMADFLGIADCLDKYPYQMSGGQQQRCAAARAMVTRPALVLADEPTGALDSKSSQLLLDRLDVLNRDLGATILMVTHDAFTASCCRRVVFLRDGKLFLELHRENDSRKAFFQKIIQVVTEMGGGMADVL